MKAVIIKGKGRELLLETLIRRAEEEGFALPKINAKPEFTPARIFTGNTPCYEANIILLTKGEETYAICPDSPNENRKYRMSRCEVIS